MKMCSLRITDLMGCLQLLVFAHIGITPRPVNVLRTDILPALTCDMVRCLGPVPYVCRHVLPCPTCSVVPRCFLKDQINEDIDKECRLQNYSEVVLKEDLHNSSVHTVLKCSGQDSDCKCPFGSVCVDDGKGSGVCCKGKLGPVDPPVKPGACPMGDFADCASKPCKKDFDCPENQKCCPSCGYLCSNPVNASELCGLVKCPTGKICLYRQPFCHGSEEPCTNVLFPTCMDPVCEDCAYNQLCIPHPSQFRTVECFSRPDCGGCPAGAVCTPDFDSCTPFECPVFTCLSDNEGMYDPW